jgi:hypothetical protein
VVGSELVRISGSKKIVPLNGGVISTFGIDGSVSLFPQEIRKIMRLCVNTFIIFFMR